MSTSTHTHLQQYSGSTNLDHIDYSYTYSSGDPDSSFVYQSPSSSSSMLLPSDLPDLYYEYDMATPPSASSSELIYTPPQVGHTTALPWEFDSTAAISFAAQQPFGAFPPSPCDIAMQQRHRATVPPPININFDSMSCQFSAMDPTTKQTPGAVFAEPRTNKQLCYPQGLLLTQPLTNSSTITSCVSPAALFANPSMSSITPTPSISHAPLKLHQPRPSRNIPIVSLDRLASACETSSGPKTVKPETQDPSAFINKWCHQVPISQNSSPIKGSRHPNQVESNHRTGMINQGIERIILCPCGCMESYSFLL